MNQRLENSVDELRQRLRFLPEREVAEELAELEAHLHARATDYEAAGESAESAASLALEKWGDLDHYVGALRRRWLLRQPVVIGSLVGTSWFGMAFLIRSVVLHLNILNGPIHAPNLPLVGILLVGAHLGAAFLAGIVLGVVLGQRLISQWRAIGTGLFIASLFYATHDPLTLAIILITTFLGSGIGSAVAPQRRRGLRR